MCAAAASANATNPAHPPTRPAIARATARLPRDAHELEAELVALSAPDMIAALARFPDAEAPRILLRNRTGLDRPLDAYPAAERTRVKALYLAARKQVIRDAPGRGTYLQRRWLPLEGPDFCELVRALQTYARRDKESGAVRDVHFPSYATLAQAIGRSESTVKRLLRRESMRRFVLRAPRRRYSPALQKGVRTSNYYLISIDTPLVDEDAAHVEELVARWLTEGSAPHADPQSTSPAGPAQCQVNATWDRNLSERAAFNAGGAPRSAQNEREDCAEPTATRKAVHTPVDNRVDNPEAYAKGAQVAGKERGEERGAEGALDRRGAARPVEVPPIASGAGQSAAPAAPVDGPAPLACTDVSGRAWEEARRAVIHELRDHLRDDPATAASVARGLIRHAADVGCPPTCARDLARQAYRQVANHPGQIRDRKRYYTTVYKQVIATAQTLGWNAETVVEKWDEQQARKHKQQQ